MAEYTIIADVSNYICKMLREKMCPEPVPSPNNIEISSPSSQDVDYIVGLYLFDIREEGVLAQAPRVSAGGTKLTRPPRPYSLYYMVFINGSSQMGLKAPDIQKIIGKVAQIVSDNNCVYPHKLQPWLDATEPPIILSQAKMGMEEKIRVWQAINKPYQIGLFFRAAPVYVSSEIVVDPPRVNSAEFSIDMIGRERRDKE